MSRKFHNTDKYSFFGALSFVGLVVSLGIFLGVSQMNTNYKQEAATVKPKYFKYIIPAGGLDNEGNPGKAEAFVVKLTNSDDIKKATNDLRRKNPRLIVSGTLKKGNGGFNKSFGFTRSGYWNWYLDPKTIAFGEFAQEVCDGRASYIQNGTFSYKRFCPWSAQPVAVFNSVQQIR